MIVVLVRVRVVNLADPISVVVTAMEASPADRVLLHVVDRVADQRTNRLTVFAVRLLDRFVYLSEPAVTIVNRRLCLLLPLVALILRLASSLVAAV